jgi:hypothetical protein
MIRIGVLVFFVSTGLFAFSQHDDKHQHHQMKMDTVKPDHSMHKMEGDEEMTSLMSHAFSLHLPMNRNGSGTAWLPDSSPMYGYMKHSKDWMFMMHGSFFLRYNNQDFSNKGIRGDDDFDAPNWFMLMGQTKVNKNGLFHFNVMVSLDAITQTGRGYPLLFQTGESFNGKSLVDRQHPHDFISELSVSYAHALSPKADVFIYAGYPGEPALGPVTFMHRPSSVDNPNSPISHHWVDATHITYGVITGGVRVGKMKLETSSFTGREPNENRYSFDRARFDSWSSRLSYNPTSDLALQISHGFVKSPEELRPDENIYKTTASAIYNKTLSGKSMINATALWGLNKQKDHDGENAAMAEAAWRKDRTAIYTRYEFTEKSAEELVLGNVFDDHDVFNVYALTLGANYDILKIRKLNLAGGGQWSIYKSAAILNNMYGKSPMSFQIYLRLYPELMKM